MVMEAEFPQNCAAPFYAWGYNRQAVLFLFRFNLLSFPTGQMVCSANFNNQNYSMTKYIERPLFKWLTIQYTAYIDIDEKRVEWMQFTKWKLCQNLLIFAVEINERRNHEMTVYPQCSSLVSCERRARLICVGSVHPTWTTRPLATWQQQELGQKNEAMYGPIIMRLRKTRMHCFIWRAAVWS